MIPFTYILFNVSSSFIPMNAAVMLLSVSFACVVGAYTDIKMVNNARKILKFFMSLFLLLSM